MKDDSTRRRNAASTLIWTGSEPLFYALRGPTVQIGPAASPVFGDRFTMLPYRQSPIVRAAMIGAVLIAAFVCRPAAGEETKFAVTVRTFVGASLDPVAVHRIVFDNGLVFDLPQLDPSTVTLYDPIEGNVTLMDRPAQVQTTIRTEDLVEITARARAAADTLEKREMLGLEAVVVPSSRLNGHAISFSGVSYETSTQRPADSLMATEFGQFNDLAARMNLVRRHWLPPFARMTLNDRVTAAGEIPLETTLTLHRGERDETYRSTMVIEDINRADQAAMKEVHGMRTLYRNVPLAEFPSD